MWEAWDKLEFPEFKGQIGLPLWRLDVPNLSLQELAEEVQEAFSSSFGELVSAEPMLDAVAAPHCCASSSHHRMLSTVQVVVALHPSQPTSRPTSYPPCWLVWRSPGACLISGCP